MALRIRFDHRFERLADALLDELDACDDGPFAERVVIVPSAGVGRWLQRRDARRHGVSARLRPEFAGRWLWQTMGLLLEGLPGQSPFEPERARWALLSLFDELPDEPDFAPLLARLGEPGSRARFVLADSVARVFERYLAYRRDWLVRWQREQWAVGLQPLGRHECWQRWLWRRLLERLPAVREEHPYDAFARLLARGVAVRMPEALAGRRVALFGRLGLSPEQFSLFGQLSTTIDVSLFAPDPCRELWTDMIDAAQLARIREQSPEVAWLYEGEPSLLGNWGRVQRDFVAQVLSLEEAFGVQAEAPGRDEEKPFEIPAAANDDRSQLSTRLQALQTAFFLRSDDAWRDVGGADSSILVLGAHGTVREAEVLHETLLECFETLPGLEPGDVVVHCVDIDSAANAIEGVFASSPESRRIPLSITGRPPRSDVTVIAIEMLLGMIVHGIDAASVDAWLRNPASMEALGLDETQVEQLLEWFARAGSCRGLDAADGSPKHSVEAATERLLLGAALGSSEVVADVLAVPGAQANRARSLDAWLPVVDALVRLRKPPQQARTLLQWCVALGDVVETLFGRVRRHAGGVQRVRDALAHLSASGADFGDVALDASAFATAFSGALEQSAFAAMPTGAVTVCPIGSLPGVPFRVVCLFGMDEGAFPRRGSADEMDLMRRAARFGDRLARIDDRGVFLDAVLSARDRLVILCQSRDPRDDAALNPSPLVTEMIAYLSARLLPGDSGAPLGLPRARPGENGGVPALVEHPIHAFSLRNFTGEDRRYAEEWLSTARALATPLSRRAPQLGPIFDMRLADSGTDPAYGATGEVQGDSVPIEVVRMALADPAATWLRKALRLELPRESPAPPDFEPLWSGDGDERAAIQRCVERLLAGEDDARISLELAIAPLTAAGAAGERHARSIVHRARMFVAAAVSDAAEIAGPAVRGEPVVVRLDGVLLRMMPPPRDSSGRVLFVSAFPLGPPALIDAWLRTAMWRLAVDPGAEGRLVTTDTTIDLHCADARSSLSHAVAWAARIASEPLAIFPRSWLHYARALARARRGADSSQLHQGRALARGQAALSGSDFDRSPPELERPAERALYRDAEIDFESVLPLCERVYRPILDDVTLVARQATHEDRR